jgi:hypothetical protein
MMGAEKKWECHVCGREDDFEILPYGYLGNYHPLCERCADSILFDKEDKNHYRLNFCHNFVEILVVNL